MTTSPAERYVSTDAARQAVSGHESTIVHALGIPWEDRRGSHIDCPYPAHGGAKKWRLTEKGRAICTCTGRKTDSVFDIACKVEALDFEAAKIRCVEILGRSELIRQRIGGGAFQASDARSLLDAPPERRDDTLPRAYLAHRLGIELDAVPMPDTPVVGLRGLAYFDPPASARAKPSKVGEYPCAVFGSVDREGREHAHRIYLAPAGAGKAELGAGPDGEPRDPKKSAKLVGKESTAGRSVFWGDPASAPWAILAEGIETAAAVAFAFRPEIASQEVAVISAINAGGIEAFKPWDATRRITVAADRDEAIKVGRKAPSQRGEQAARTFAIRAPMEVCVSIALPGEPGTATDWLDVHGADGTEAVRAGILAAEAFTPVTEESEAERKRTEDLEELRRVERDYPLPPLDTLDLSYQRTAGGKIRVHRRMQVGDTVETQPIASPFGVLARLRFADQDDAYGLRIAVEDMGGRRREIDIDRGTLAKQAGTEVRALLFDAGLRTEDDGELVAVRCLKAADPVQEITVVRAPGWHTLAGQDDRFFVCPSGQIVGGSDGNPLELSAAARISASVAKGGTLEGWKAAVAAAVAIPGCQHWALGAMAGFAGPLIALLGLDTCGINISGRTSGGKTTAQRLAVSAWSRAALDQRDSLLQTARATANGVEAMASRADATILALDELGHVNGVELGKIIYSVASGVGKSRMTPTGALRPSLTWSTFVLLSAEKSLEEKVRGDGGDWFGGMAVRMPDVDITGVDRAVDAGVRARIHGVDQHYGQAGPAFVAALIEQGGLRQAEGIRDLVNQGVIALAGAGADASLSRAAEPFAVLAAAGTLAKEFGILPEILDVHGAIRWAWARFRNSSDAMALDPEAQATAALRIWILERWDSTIYPTELAEGRQPPSKDSFGWYDDDAVYIPRHRLVEAAGNALKEVEVARALDRQGFIVKRKSERHLAVAYVAKLGKADAYALSRQEFGRIARTEPLFAVYAGGRA